MALDELSIKNSAWAWNTLREARNLDSQLHEETITDLLVHNIKKWGAGKILIKDFNKHEEALNGSDWEWWFTGPTGKWLGMRVQAKVLNLKSGKYEHLHHKNKNGAQVDLLVNAAKASNAIPLYCLYTNWDTAKYKASWACNTYKQTVRHYGTAVLNPDVVKSLQTTKETRLEKIIHSLRPMHCIFCCSGYSPGDLPNRALGWLRGEKLLEAGALEHESYLKDAPPPHVARLLQSDSKNELLELGDDRLGRITVFSECEEHSDMISPHLIR
ncbi:hypothetical protein MQC82_11070 [Pseudomonas viridiflava]|uniref:DUF6615 family protein n=1 Tax=Pseudomonas viridiflava TaxID=33069 RepID=UPI000F014BA3|nr:DUF6615 family protein [Pseudomonas viridiflava]MBV1810505.1 hypothetical protein [Pseudomonas viridiflava]MCI3910101.1 hypothetical protein [Pseudomonas viridiflava]QXG45386.1 hypothetical protein KTT57_17340 [Pseudomonas viridiflava]